MNHTRNYKNKTSDLSLCAHKLADGLNDEAGQSPAPAIQRNKLVRPARASLSPLFLLCALMLVSAPAAAEPDEDYDDDKEKRSKFILALDGEFSAIAHEGSQPIGGGFGLRMGRHHPFLGIFAFRPEIGGGYNRLMDHDTGRVFAGARLGFNFLVGVYAYGHAGYGWGAPRDGFMYDVGGAVDLLVLNIIRPGLHLEYERIVNQVESVNGGVHLEFAF